MFTEANDGARREHPNARWGNGWFGGFTPLIATSIVASTGNKVAGLWYPIAVALMTFVIGSLFLKESRGVKIWDEVGGEVAAARAAGD